MVDPSLSIKGLRAGYGSLDILNGVDLDVPQGQFVALMGPNGAGKSTLLKSLYGMTTIKDGSIEWQGKNIAGYKSRAILAEGVAFGPQGRCNFPVMTTDENLQMAYTLRDARVKSIGTMSMICSDPQGTQHAGGQHVRWRTAIAGSGDGRAAAKNPARRRTLGRSFSRGHCHRL